MAKVVPVIDQPESGYFYLRRGPRGIKVPVRIWHSGERWRCTVAFEELDPYEVWPWCAGKTMTEGEYVDVMTRIKHDISAKPWSPYANYRKKLDYIGLTETVT